MFLDFKGKKSLVCGSTGGIGKATALKLAGSGSDVTLFARDEYKLRNVLKLLPVNGDQKHDFLIADFSDPQTVNSQINGYIGKGNKFHIVINNTGGPPPGMVLESAPEDFLNGFNTHLISFQHILKAVVAGMKNQNFGRIINVISTSVKIPIPGLGVSNTVRGAVASWAKTLASELGPYGITVNNILPGYTDTTRLNLLIENKARDSGITPDDLSRQIRSSIPCRRFADPDETAYAILFLASEQASYINGINLPVDGGSTLCL